MPTQKPKRNQIYGFTKPLTGLQQEPIVQQRAPTGYDDAELGTIWVDEPSQDFRILTHRAALGGNVWTGTSGGATTLASLTVNPGDIDVTAGNINVAVGNLTMNAASTATVGTLAAGNTSVSGTLGVIGNATFGGDVAVTGNVTVNGDFDITDTASISLTSTNNAAGAITLLANGGVAETISITSAQGTGVASLNFASTAGGVTFTTGLATADSFNIASSGGVDVDGALQINITSSQNAGNAIVLNASAGGIDILAAGAAGEDTDITNTAGSINITAGEAAADAIVISASNAAGGLSIGAGTGGILLGASNGDVLITSGTGALSVSADAAATVVRLGTGAAVKTVVVGSTDTTSTTTIQSGTGGVIVTSTDEILLDCAGVLELNSSAGVISIANDAVNQNVNIATAGARTVTIGNVTGATGVVLNSGTGGVAINTTGTGDVVITSADTTTLDSVGGIEINSSAGSILVGNDAIAQAIGIGTGAAARTITVGNIIGATAVNVNSGTGGINLSSAGIFTLDAVADTQASPSATSVIAANVGAATFTGFTTASAATQVFTITNALVSATSQILCSASNEGANDAQMTVTRINRGAGTFGVSVRNNGAAALNGNVTITFMVLN